MPDPSLLVLQAVRLAGVAGLDAILDRALIDDRDADRVLSAAAASEEVEWFSFGDSSGWIITEAGSARLAALLRDESAGAPAAVLASTLEAFEPLNGQFVGLVSQWQLRSTSAVAGGFGAAEVEEAAHLLDELAVVGSQLRETLAGLIRVLPRFGRYPAQYASALEQARHEGLRWVTGVGLLSCHVVWAELHQDLLSSLGRGRFDQPQIG